jgi:hypothetical protein
MQEKSSMLRRFWRFLWKNRVYTLPFTVLVVCMGFINLDNPTGIVLGWMAVSILLVALVKRWQKFRYYGLLLVMTILCGILVSGIDMAIALRLAKLIGGPEVTENVVWVVYNSIISNFLLLTVPMCVLFSFMGPVVLGVVKLVKLIQKQRSAAET